MTDWYSIAALTVAISVGVHRIAAIDAVLSVLAAVRLRYASLSAAIAAEQCVAVVEQCTVVALSLSLDNSLVAVSLTCQVVSA